MNKKERLEQFLSLANITLDGEKPWDIRIHNSQALTRILAEPSIGGGESYMAGWWDCQQLDELFYRITRFLKPTQLYKWHTFIRFFLRHYFSNLQSSRRARQVAIQHYDLDNTMYRSMLGPSMAYTCGYWSHASNLDMAQYAKYDLICQKLELKNGETLLELGCGWGGFAKYAAEKYGVHVTAVNISQQQMDFAKQHCAELPVQLYTTDYRNSTIYNPKAQQFDKIASIGMCEHVGHRNYRKYLQIVHDHLKPEGLFLMHTIGRNTTVNFSDPWIQKYIFPNGMLPSLKQLSAKSENRFVIEDLHNFGPDYDKTLLAWHENFVKNWASIQEKYSNEFFRMWVYYLLSCAGAFRSRSMQLWQFVMSKEGRSGIYRSIR